MCSVYTHHTHPPFSMFPYWTIKLAKTFYFLVCQTNSIHFVCRKYLQQRITMYSTKKTINNNRSSTENKGKEWRTLFIKQCWHQFNILNNFSSLIILYEKEPEPGGGGKKPEKLNIDVWHVVRAKRGKHYLQPPLIHTMHLLNTINGSRVAGFNTCKKALYKKIWQKSIKYST